MTPPRTGRPREFDPEVVLDRAMEAFWTRGYDGTSMADLMDATGLQKGSLYKAFGDKRALYFAVLRRYLEAGGEKARQLLESGDSPRESIANWYEQVTTGCSTDGGPGCFGVNAMVELGGQDEELQALVGAHLKHLNKQLEAVVARGQVAGEFRQDVPAAELADFLSVFLWGLNAKARGPLSKARARRLIAGALAALDP